MNCPTCPNQALALSDRQGIEIDYCPQCHGVWLDRGELDKLIERAALQGAPHATDMDHGGSRADFVASDQAGPAGIYGYSRQRKRSWLSDIFD